ncbi:ABC-F family ATP-binding cassette domain-containing protein [Parvicella tangerina]|uniref:Energy-dependent translational throttle protein EttA n=1 Tax=Parvicella tangerina TaxID=2829795 RepID=A0A916JPD3_9FLAO|nr:ABC-F family ATP-binding cassette domain-containing protein [Parvicella tangerina]CAG5084479.1 Energy-dependent translational throttle protein EttA [Parvicella tangerina]
MNYLSVEKISKNYADKLLFHEISFGIDQGQKIALVAKNGSGKTSLLNCLLGNDIPDAGSIVFRNDLRIGYLAQEENFDPNLSVIDTVFDSENKALSLIKEYEQELESNPSSDRLNDLYEQISDADAWGTENKVREILSKLQLSNFNQLVGKLSGGQKRRLALAKVLIEEPDILILDEPTNHLDLGMIEWLEGYLALPSITLFMVTHDRYFLERVCDEIYELDQGNLYRYKGNYSYYLDKREERYANQQVVIDKAKNLFKKELEWMRRQPKARGTKAKARVDQFYETKKVAHQNIDEKKLDIQVKMERLGTKILELHKLSKSFGEKKILDQFSYIFKRKERIGLVGANGSGKSTFLNLITQNLKPDAGKIVTGETIVFGYYHQKGLQLKEDKRVIEVIRDIADYIPIAGGKKITASQMLEKFLFPSNKHYLYASQLSGGERKRLYLLTILMKNPNFLILDEPTNDLDIFTLQVLEDYLVNYEGCLLVVSHDRYFMDKLVDHLFVLNGDGTVSDVIGNYADYRVFKKQQSAEQKEKSDPPKKAPTNTSSKKISYKDKYEFEQLDKEIPELEDKKSKLSEQLNDASLDYEEIEKISAALTKLVEDLDTKTMRWMELADLMS